MTNLRVHCPTIYGPVQSRRHGLSLGINLGDPHAKICTWGCIYCQCGFGARKESTDAAPDQHLPMPAQVIADLAEACRRHPDLDSVTLAGNSEPTANPKFPEIVQEVLSFRKRISANWIFNCLSNGSELAQDRIVQACDTLDEIWVKLDCGTDDLFRRLNRPVSSVGSVEAHVNRILRLKRPMLQSLFWKCTANPEVSNWTEENRSAILTAYEKIGPKQIFLTTVDREPAFPGAEPVAKEELVAYADLVRSRGLPVKVFA